MRDSHRCQSKPLALTVLILTWISSHSKLSAQTVDIRCTSSICPSISLFIQGTHRNNCHITNHRWVCTSLNFCTHHLTCNNTHHNIWWLQALQQVEELIKFCLHSRAQASTKWKNRPSPTHSVKSSPSSPKSSAAWLSRFPQTTGSWLGSRSSWLMLWQHRRVEWDRRKRDTRGSRSGGMTAQGRIRSKMKSMTNEKVMNISAQASRATCLQKLDARTAENREIRVAS